MIYDAIFFVTSALTTIQTLSKYSDEERYKQTLETIQSIKKYAPEKHYIYLIDGSTEDPNPEYFKTIENMGVEIFKAYEKNDVRENARKGFKIFIENLCIHHFLRHFAQTGKVSKRIYKLSGRYVLNSNFQYGFEHENSFVFLKSFDSWLSIEHQKYANASKFYETRLYHMDYSLLKTYQEEITNMIHESIKYGINVEHAAYKCLNKYKVVELEKIGVSGFISPSGEYKDD